MKSLHSCRLSIPVLLLSLVLAGCTQGESAGPAANDPGAAAHVPELGDPAAEPDDAMIAAANGRQIELTPENTTIQFVGLHADPDDPRPRIGRFEKFTGKVTIVDERVTAIHVEIMTASVTTEIDKLTNHLKNSDFFNVSEHPKATFTSTKIEPAAEEEQQVTITGDLTLLGNTQAISFPATVSTEGDFSLQAEFQIDRTRFGMDYGTDNVLKEVDMTISVNE